MVSMAPKKSGRPKGSGLKGSAKKDKPVQVKLDEAMMAALSEIAGAKRKALGEYLRDLLVEKLELMGRLPEPPKESP